MSQNLITKKEWVPVLIILAVILASIIFYPRLPDRVPSHWNIQGEIDGYAGKNFTVTFFPSVIIFLYLLVTFLPFLDPLKKNIETSGKAYFWLRTILVGFFALIYFYTLYAGISNGRNFSGNFIFFILGVMFVAMGFLLPGFKRNYFLGIRTPWTLDSDEVWRKTHQRAKKWFIGAGVLMIIGSLFKNLKAWFLILIFFPLLWPVVDSYFIYKKSKQNHKD